MSKKKFPRQYTFEYAFCTLRLAVAEDGEIEFSLSGKLEWIPPAEKEQVAARLAVSAKISQDKAYEVLFKPIGMT